MTRVLTVRIGDLNIGAQVSALTSEEADLYDVRTIDNAVRFRVPRTPATVALRSLPAARRLLTYDDEVYRIVSWSESGTMIEMVAEINRLGGT